MRLQANHLHSSWRSGYGCLLDAVALAVSCELELKPRPCARRCAGSNAWSVIRRAKVAIARCGCSVTGHCRLVGLRSQDARSHTASQQPLTGRFLAPLASNLNQPFFVCFIRRSTIDCPLDHSLTTSKHTHARVLSQSQRSSKQHAGQSGRRTDRRMRSLSLFAPLSAPAGFSRRLLDCSVCVRARASV